MGGRLDNSLVIGNQSGRGGGLYGFSGGRVIHCTFSSNDAAQYGGGIYCDGPLTNLNTIVYGNTAGEGAPEFAAVGSGWAFAYCCMPTNPGGAGNITADPAFAAPVVDAYALRPTSPCVNAGNDAFTSGALDLALQDRIQGGRVDLGAYETGFRYVSRSGAHTEPYSDWATAATTLQAAVDASADWGIVLVTNGLYDAGGARSPGADHLTSRVVIAGGILVRSVNGPSSATIQGAGPIGSHAVRCAHVGSDSFLDGFTLQGGCTWSNGSLQVDRSGGGCYLAERGTMSNCDVFANAAHAYGGGVFIFSDGTVADCRIATNASFLMGAGVCCWGGGTVFNSMITDNVASNSSGGGLAFLLGGEACNCLVARNKAEVNGGGVSFASEGTIRNCTIAENWAYVGGGGVECLGGGSARNSIIYTNTAQLHPDTGNFTNSGGTWSHCCTTPDPAEAASSPARRPL